MNPARQFERTSKEYIVLSLSLMTALALFPFTVHRIVTEDWLIAGFDAVVMTLAISLFTYTYKTRKADVPSLCLAFLFIAGELLSVVLKGQTQILWAFPCTVGVYYLTTALRALFMNSVAIIIFFMLVKDDLQGVERAAFVLSLVATNVFTLVFAVRNSIQKKQLEELTLKDPLTGVHNRRAFENYLDEMDLKDRAGSVEQSLIMIDVDHFKKVNDVHGHLAGDNTLRRLVTLIQTQLHSDELIYRIGGEEYAIAPIRLNLKNTFDFAERLRKIIEHSNIHEDDGITVSLGIAALRGREPAREWVSRADHALYDAKRRGRNQSQMAE